MSGSPHRAARVLVVDDEPSITDAVATALGYEGFEVATAVNGRAALARVEDFRPDLVVLDVMLPDLDGIDITRRLRRDGIDVPVLFLTAKDDAGGQGRGADGRRRRLRHQAVHPGRGHRPRARDPAPHDRARRRRQGRLSFADLEMGIDTHEVLAGAVEPLRLTATEFNLLRFFMENPRLVLSKTQILDHVWSYDFDGDPNVVETYVSYLRKKLDGLGPPLIHTIRLVGYTLREAED